VSGVGTLPPVVSVIGLKDSGKTSVAVELVKELGHRGRSVMVVKHGHHFRLDTEGTDSWKLRHEGGARRIVLAGPDEMAVMGDWPGDVEPDLHEIVARHLSDAEIVVAEGFKAARVPKIEVYRTEAHPLPLYGSGRVEDEDYLAICTDAPGISANVPIVELSAPNRASQLAEIIEAALLD
jgi:molybdopterin-guanine dinucleotide biosynthesis protein MobB